MSALTKAAVVGTLLSANRSMRIDEIRAAVLAKRPLDEVVGPLTAKRLSDLLRYQQRRGLVLRVGRGRYRAVPEGVGRTTRWRYRNWERRFDAYRSHG